MAYEDCNVSACPSHLRIIVVDDNEDSADLLQRVLERDGHRVAAAYDGKSALKLVDEWNPDVVFLDIGMPNMNGYEVARTLRRLPNRESMQLIAMTGWGQLDDEARAMDAGFNRHVAKPLTPERLRKLLSESAGE